MYLENYIIISYIYIINRYFISSVRFTDFVHIEADYYDKKVSLRVFILGRTEKIIISR